MHLAKKFWLPFILVCLIVGLYGHTLHSPFYLDDKQNILSNPGIRITSLEPESFKQVFTSELNVISRRPVAYASFALNYLAGGYSLPGYHVVNILIHIVTSLLIFVLLHWYCNNAGYKPRTSLLISFSATLIWALSPIQTSAVTYIVQRMTSLSTLFFIAALLSYLAGREICRNSASGRLPYKGVLLLGISAFLWVLALLTKEIAGIFPVIILLHELFFFDKFSWKKIVLKKYFYLSCILFPVGLGLFYLGPGFWKSIINGYSTPDFTLKERLLTQPRVIFRYFSLFLWPDASRLALYHDFPLSSSLTSPFSTILSITGLSLLAGTSFFYAKRFPLICFGILWTFACLVIESSLIPLQIIFEHRFYLPSVGFSLSVVLLFYHLCSYWFRHNTIFTVVILFFALGCALQTYKRNSIWADYVQFHEQEIKLYPNNIAPYLSLVQYYFDNKDSVAMVQWLDRASAVEPDNISVLAGYFILHLSKNSESKASYYYKKIKNSINNDNADCTKGRTIHSLANVFFSLGDYNEAIELHRAISKCRIMDPEHYSKIALSYHYTGNNIKAIENFNNALSLDPDNQFYIYNLLALFFIENQWDKARAALKKIDFQALSPEYHPDVKRVEAILQTGLRGE